LRVYLFFPVLPLVVGLLAWVHYDSETTLSIVILESLDAGTAGEVLPIFEAELAAHLARDQRRASFAHVHVTPSTASTLPDLERLSTADLVVSFGTAAAERGSRLLRGAATPHLFAYLPRDHALSLTNAATGDGRARTTGIIGQLPRGAAFAIAAQLLASRDAPPLRIGILHQTSPTSQPRTQRLLAEVANAPGFVSVPFMLHADADTPAMLASVAAAAVEAARRELPVDAFWLALDAAAPLDLLVRAIERRTGLPVVYAPSEAAVAAGALMSLAPEPRSTAREAALLAKRLLDGATPADIPVRAPHRVDFSLNLETADGLGIVPSHELMELARGRLFR
jgi:putative tryptophan/tyrosine transport system substrate-binding protein